MAAQFGILPRDFMQMTPRDFRITIESMITRRKQEIDECNMRAGVIAATITNVFSKKKRKPGDFFKPLSEKKRKKAKTPEEMAVIFKAITMAFGGEING